MIEDIPGINKGKDIEPFIREGEYKLDYKRDFVKWLEKNFRYFSTSLDAAALEEIKQNANKIYDGVNYLKTITETRSAPALQRYYARDWLNITTAYKKNDIENFARAISGLMDGIKLE
jgi:hypothetical protein